MKPSLKTVSYRELTLWLEQHGQPRFRASQIHDWLFAKRAMAFADMNNLPAALREALEAEFTAFSLKPVRKQVDGDHTVKWLSELGDGKTIETVLIRAPERDTVCISSQVGCPVCCVFCATGKMGFQRNLKPAEILDQVILASNEIGHLVSNVVVMGMGEPLLNFDNVEAALVMLSSQDGLGLGVRHVTVSTSGIPDGIRRLADSGYPWNLAVSLHAATDAQRAKLIPPKHRAPLEDILAAMEYHSQATHRMPTFEVVLINGVNDSAEDATRLANIAHQAHAKVNLIPCNNDSGPYQAPPPEKCSQFLRHLISRKIQATLRLRKGKGIDAACGQLRSKSMQPPEPEELP